MVSGLSDLFKYKKEIPIKNPKTGKVKTKVWIRLLGDDDIKEAYKISRVASAAKRASLRDENSLDYKESMAQLGDLSQADLKELILAEAENSFNARAQAVLPFLLLRLRTKLPPTPHTRLQAKGGYAHVVPGAPSLADVRLQSDLSKNRRGKPQWGRFCNSLQGDSGEESAGEGKV